VAALGWLAALPAGRAHQDRLRFLLHASRELLSRHQSFDVVATGHDMRVQKATAGRIDDIPVRPFDLCFGLRRGLRRRSCPQAVLIAESPRPLHLKMWTADNSPAPLPEAGIPGKVAGPSGFSRPISLGNPRGFPRVMWLKTRTARDIRTTVGNQPVGEPSCGRTAVLLSQSWLCCLWYGWRLRPGVRIRSHDRMRGRSGKRSIAPSVSIIGPRR